MIGLATTAALATAAGTAAWGVYNPRSRLFGPIVQSGDASARNLYLTFDDGPNHHATPAVLEALEQGGVPAAFFMVGRHVERFPDEARAVARAGHDIGNHTYRHVKLHRHGPARIADELQRCHASIRTVAGVTPRAFRAPHGYRNPWVAPAVAQLGYQSVAWTVGVWDTARPGAEVIRARVRRALAPGAILLLHDGDGYDPHGDRMQTARALPGILQDAKDAGYAFRPLAELLA